MGLAGQGVDSGQQLISFGMHQAVQVCAGDLSLLQVVRPSRPISWSEGCLDRPKCPDRPKCLGINFILVWLSSWELRSDLMGIIWCILLLQDLFCPPILLPLPGIIEPS